MGHGHSHDAHGHSHGGGDHGHSHGGDGACSTEAAQSGPLQASLGGGRSARAWATFGPSGGVLHLALIGCVATEARSEFEVSDWSGSRPLTFQPLQREARPAGEGAGACTRCSAAASRMSVEAGPLTLSGTLRIDGADVPLRFEDFFPARHGADKA